MHRDKLASIAIAKTEMQVFWADADGRLVEVNEAACQSLGYAREELLGMLVADVDSVYSHSSWPQVLHQLRLSRRLRVESRHRRKDGSEYPVELHISLVQSDEGELVCGFATDISERMLAQEALTESTQRYRSVIDTARDGYIVTDTAARIVEVNETYCSASGYSRDELLAMTIGDLEAKESGEETRDHFATIRQQGGDLFESVHRRKDGETWPVEVSVSYSPIEGGRYFSFVRDTRERKLLEQLAALRQELGEIVYQGSMDDLMRRALDTAEAMTDSTIGFFHFVERDQLNLSLQVWSTRTLRDMCFAEGEGMHYPVEEAGVWVDCIHQRRPVIHNDYASLPHKKGMPEGHPLLLRELTMPVFREGLIVAVMGIGNKASPYTQHDL